MSFLWGQFQNIWSMSYYKKKKKSEKISKTAALGH